MAEPVTLARLSGPMRDALVWLLSADIKGRRLGAYPRRKTTWEVLERLNLAVYDFRSGTGGRHLTDEGRRLAIAILANRQRVCAVPDCGCSGYAHA